MGMKEAELRNGLIRTDRPASGYCCKGCGEDHCHSSSLEVVTWSAKDNPDKRITGGSDIVILTVYPEDPKLPPVIHMVNPEHALAIAKSLNEAGMFLEKQKGVTFQ